MKKVFNINYPRVQETSRIWNYLGMQPITRLYVDIRGLTNFLRHYINVYTKIN